MRTIDEIDTEFRMLVDERNVTRMLELADELQSHDSDVARAMELYFRSLHAVWRAQYDRALEYGRQAQIMYEELGDDTGLSRVLYSIGEAHFQTGRFTQALEHFERCVVLDTELGRRRALGSTLLNIGRVHNAIGQHDVSLEYYHRSLDVQRQEGYEFGVAIALGNIGDLLRMVGDYAGAFDYFHRAMDMYAAMGNQSGIAWTLVDLGLVAELTENFAVALEHLQHAQQILISLENPSEEAFTWMCVGRVYHAMKNTEQAYFYYNKSLDRFTQLGQAAKVGDLKGHLIALLLETDRIDEAAELLREQESEPKFFGNTNVQYLLNLGHLNMLKGDLDEAERLMVEALDIAHASNRKDLLPRSHEYLRELARQRNDLPSYVKHNDEALRLNEEIRGKQTSQRMTLIEAERRMTKEREEREREQALLYGALPKSIADRKLRGEDVSGDSYESASVLFLDIVGFTSISDRLPPQHVVQLLAEVFKICDDICAARGLSKIKTIGDSYMAVAFPEDGGRRTEDGAEHVAKAARAAVDMLHAVSSFDTTTLSHLGSGDSGPGSSSLGPLQVRIGIHSGPVVAGIVGHERLQYDVWGDTVNVASRMESSSEPGRIQVSEVFAHALQKAEAHVLHSPSSVLRERGMIEVKGKGQMKTFWLEGA